MDKNQKIPSFSVNVTTLPSSGYALALRPGEKERAAIARAAGVTAIERLEAELVLRRWRRDGVELSGRLRARVEQPCIVTLDPVFEDIDVPVRLTFLPERSSLAKPVTASGHELVLDPEGDDPPETFAGDSIDVWPVIVEMLLLAIDPFPRSPGAELPLSAAMDEEVEESAGKSPFSVLGELKTPKK